MGNSVYRTTSKECYGCLYTLDPLLPRSFLPDLVVSHDPTSRGRGQTTPATTQTIYYADRGPAMKSSTPKSRPVQIVECLIDMYLARGIDLKSVTLAEFKMRFREVARGLRR